MKKVYSLIFMLISTLCFATTDTVTILGTLTRSNTGITPKIGWFVLPKFQFSMLPSGEEGALIYDATNKKLLLNNGEWVDLVSSDVIDNVWSCKNQPQCNVDLGDYSLTCKSVTLDGNDLQGLLGAKVPYTGATGDVNLGGYSLLADGLGANYFGIETYGMYQVGSIYNPEEEGFAVTIRSGGLRPYNAITTDGFYARRFVGLSYGSDTKPYIALDDGYKIGENRMFYVNPFVTKGDVFYLTGRNGSFNISKDIALSITKDSVAYEIWSAYNDGRDSGLDADLLDGNHALDFEPALSKGNLSESTSSVLTITGGTNSVIGSGTTIQVKQASALQDGYLAKEDFATFNSKDGVVGNEVTDTADTTLTRTGTGASEDPYKLKLNLANANTFTANQTAPYFLQSSQYDPDNPRPYGFPQTSANALDDEFNDGNFSGWTTTWLTGSPSITEANGLVKISNAHSGYIYKAVDDGDYRITLKGSLAYDTKIGVAVLKSDGTGYAVCLVSDGAAYRKVISYKITKASNNWDTLTAVTTINYHDATYLGLRYWNDGGTRKISWGTSINGFNFETFAYGVTAGVPSEVNYIGIYSNCGGATGDFMRGASTIVDWFRVD